MSSHIICCWYGTYTVVSRSNILIALQVYQVYNGSLAEWLSFVNMQVVLFYVIFFKQYTDTSPVILFLMINTAIYCM